MSLQKQLKAAADEPGVRAALLFALVAERLTQYYEHDQWLKEGQGATLATDWLTRSNRTLPSRELRRLSAASDDLAREVEAGLSREAGLYTAHEMTESLDPNVQSDIGQSLMEECRRRIEAMDSTDGASP